MASQVENEILCQYPLHYLSRSGDATGLQQCLMKTSFSPFDPDSLNYWTPAHWAASTNQCNCLMILAPFRALDVAAHLSLTTPLHIAAEMGFEDCLLVLIRNGARINFQDSSGDTPLHKAARHGHISCMKMLLEAGACADTRNFYKRTASEVAAINGHFTFASLVNEASRIKKQENHIPPNVSILRNNNVFACKRSRDSLASVGALDGDLSDKRLRFSDPVFQIAADMVGQGGHKLWQNDIQSSIFEHATQLRMTDAYEELYNSRFANSLN
ncbi:ankyrin repeat domain containing protein 10 [Echinococcus multilocularis]|uniref:Ankyrin repeat domain containing protein 10 n=1 Tax=Echinococcus multilocularis TaxID=6211 RepID=A0A087W226_ECHMU|nr:ankyrin repeat domain containing protein 10 [Echinococcus multilocularis]